MTGGGSTQRGNQTNDTGNLDALQRQLALAIPHQVPAADGNNEHSTDNPRRDDGMAELIDGKRRERHIEERHHLVAHRVGIELTTHGILHPGVGNQNPPGGDGGTQTREPGGSQVEARRHFLPAEIHNSHKGRLHEERHDALDGQRRPEDIAHEPRVVAPVGTKLELEDDAGSHTHGEIDAEEFLPEARGVFPETLAVAIVDGLTNTHNDCQAQGERHKQPVIDSGQRKLRPRPVNGPAVDG